MLESRPDPEVPAKARRRRHSAEYKLILEEADRATEPGQVGALLRREGLYSSHLAAWREQRAGAILGVEGLYVVDASVMPEIPAANTNLPTIMVSERIASILADD